jgi:hypothetical protein
MAAKVDWSRRFAGPILMPDGSTIRTIGEAAEYATSLPRKIGNKPQWQRAADALHQAAEHGGPFVFIARISFAQAVYGEDGPPIGNPRGKKGHRGRNTRKLADQ